MQMDNLLAQITKLAPIFGFGACFVVFVEVRVAKNRDYVDRRVDALRKETEFRDQQREASTRLSIDKMSSRIDSIERNMATTRDTENVKEQVREVKTLLLSVQKTMMDHFNIPRH